VNTQSRFRGNAALLIWLLAQAPAASAEVILHAFNWRYDEVAANADEIAARGFASVLVSPPLKSEGSAWWARYQPQDYRVIDHALGNTESFRQMSQRLAAAGVSLYADIVVNHMANEASQRPDLNYPGQRVLDLYASDPAWFERQRLYGDLRFNQLSSLDFREARCITDYNNVYQVQHWRLCGGGGDPGLPDLNDNDWVVSQQRLYLAALKGLGVSGFRIDAAKHMTPKQIARIFTPAIIDDSFVFGEVITGAGAGNLEYEQYLLPYLADTSHRAYDFPMHASLRGAFAFGGNLANLVDPLAAGQALPGDRAVTFTVTHDIPNNSGFRGLLLDPVDETLAYAYILGRDGGTPMLYSDHNESGDNRWVEAWRRTDLNAMVDFHNRMVGQDLRMLAAGPCFVLFRRGALGLVGINKCGNGVDVEIDISADKLWWRTPYRDLLGGTVINIDRRGYRITLPARTARMWVREAAGVPPAAGKEAQSGH
jgi:alpha-amylase